jgi:hypothetical protein
MQMSISVSIDQRLPTPNAVSGGQKRIEEAKKPETKGGGREVPREFFSIVDMDPKRST